MKKMGADSLPELVRMAEKIGIPGSFPSLVKGQSSEVPTMKASFYWSLRK
jgi:hypothetical protein